MLTGNLTQHKFLKRAEKYNNQNKSLKFFSFKKKNYNFEPRNRKNLCD